MYIVLNSTFLTFSYSHSVLGVTSYQVTDYSNRLLLFWVTKLPIGTRFPELPKPCLKPVCKVLICLSGACVCAACVCAACLGHVAIAIDLSEVAARAKERGKWRQRQGVSASGDILITFNL